MELVDQLEMQSDLFRTFYLRAKELDARSLARMSDEERAEITPLTHEDLCAIARERIARMD